MPFQIHALPRTPFEPLFEMSDSKLAAIQAVRMRVDTKPGYPCRISLEDADVGENVVLLNYEHQPADSPYKSSHAIFVREHAKQAFPAPDTIPDAIAERLISVRGFDDTHCMVNADVVHGSELSESINTLFADKRIAYLHLHNAKPGCFAARVTRV